MAYLFESLIENRWALQVIQHAFALHTQMPVRLARVTRAKENYEIWKHFDHNREKNDWTFTPPAEMTDFFRFRENSVWTTLPSNPHPLIENLRDISLWRLWEQHNIARLLTTSQTIVPYFKNPMKIALRKLNIMDKLKGHFPEAEYLLKCAIAVGPLIVIEPAPECLRQSTDSFLKALASSLPTGTYQERELGLLILSGKNVGPELFESRARLLQRALTCLLLLKYDGEEIKQLHRSTYNTIAQIALLVNRAHTRTLLSELPENSRHDIIFPLRQRDETIEMIAHIRSDGSRALSLRKGNAGSTFRIDPVYSKGRELARQFKVLEDEMQINFASYQDGYFSQRLTRLRNWLNLRFGIASGYLKDKEGGGSATNIYDSIAAEMTRLFTADISTIFNYDRTTPLLQLHAKGISFANSPQTGGPGAWRSALTSLMLEAGKNPIWREMSISYRCADDGRRQVTWASDENGVGYDPPGSNLLIPEAKNYDIHRSAMVVPLTVYDRLFGVMEIGGFKPYQFRVDNLILAEHLGKTIGTFLYSKEVMSSLGVMNSNILGYNANDYHEKYRIICRELATIFLANAAAIYVPGDRSGEYYLRQWFNRPDLDSLSLWDSMNITRSIDMMDSPVAMGLQAKTDYYDSLILELLEKDPNWPGRAKGRQGLLNFDWIVVIPLRERQTNNLIAGVSLYYKEGKSPSPQRTPPPLASCWVPTMKFISDQVAVLITAIESQHRVISERKSRELLREHLLRVLRHEVKYSVDMLGKRAEEIVFLAQASKNFSEDTLDKMNGASRDLISYRKVLMKIMADLPGKWPNDDPKNSEHVVHQTYPPVDLFDVISEISTELIDKYRKRNIHFDLCLPSRILFIQADTLILQSIFRNLLVNAAKYSTDGAIGVSLVDGDKSVEVHIVNQALGISEEDHRSIFLWGRRGENSKEVDGDGDGLALSQNFCAGLEGEIRLRLRKLSDQLMEFDFVVDLPKRIFMEVPPPDA